MINIKEIHLHPDFDRSAIDYDYSLLKLKTPLALDETIRPIALPDSGAADVADGTLCTISGWGTTLNDSESSSTLRAAEVPIVNQDECIASYEELADVTPRMICAGLKQGGKDCECESNSRRLDSSNGD